MHIVNGVSKELRETRNSVKPKVGISDNEAHCEIDYSVSVQLRGRYVLITL